MAGKPITLAGKRAAYALDHVSKNTLADILIDRIRVEVGEDASDEEILKYMQPWLDTITRLRGDKPVSLLGLVERMKKFEAKYLERQAKGQAK